MNEFDGKNMITTMYVNPIRFEEKKRIKKVCNLIGASYIVLSLIPELLNALLSLIVMLIGQNQQAMQILSDPAFTLFIQIFYSIIMFTLPFIILPLGLGSKVSELANISKPKWNIFFPFIMIGVGTSAFANLITNQIVATFEGFGINFLSPSFDYPEGIFGILLSYIAIAVTPALVEEFATRGMVMGAARKHGELFGLIVSSFFFSLMHGNLVQIPFAFIMGLVIGYAVIKSGSIITGMAIHFLNNAISVTMGIFLEKIESTTIQGVISIVYIGICALLLLLGLFLAYKKDKGVWRLEKGESLLSNGEKMKCFFFSPTVIIGMVMTAVECFGMISFG